MHRGGSSRKQATWKTPRRFGMAVPAVIKRIVHFLATTFFALLEVLGLPRLPSRHEGEEGEH